MRSQPSSASLSRVASSSTPAATTCIRRLCASWIVELTMASSVAFGPHALDERAGDVHLADRQGPQLR
jgi:hypothetical protein